MELRQLRYFIDAAESENFSVAAQKNFVVQSTLSQQIRQLETDLGTTLFERQGKRVYLSESGKAFLPFARETIAKAEEGRQRLSDMENMKGDTLRIGASYGHSVLLTHTMQHFCPQFPDIQLQVVFRQPGELMEMLIEHEIDFALSYTTSREQNVDTEQIPLFEGRLSAIVDERHVLARRESVRLSELKAFLTSVTPVGSVTRAALNRVLREKNVELKPLLEINDIYTMLHMVHSCHMVAILPDSVIYGQEGLKAIPIEDCKESFHAALIYLKDAYQRRAVKEFYKRMMQ